MFEAGGQLCVTKSFIYTFLHFPPLSVTTSPGGGKIDWIQTMVDVSECSVHVCNTVSSRVGMVSAVCVYLQTLVGSASQIALCL